MMALPNAHPRRNPRAFTMIEATISVAIVGMLMATCLTTMGQIAKSRNAQAERRAGLELAQQLLSEVVSQYFQDPGSSPVFGPESGETRATYEDVDDYSGFSETNPTLKDGTPLSDFTGWTRTVSVTYADPSNPSNSISSSTLKLITVNATAPSGKVYTLTALRSKYGVYESAPPSLMTYVNWIGINLQAGNSPKYIRTGVRPLNEVVTQP